MNQKSSVMESPQFVPKALTLDSYITPSSPQLNGKVERSHRSDQEEFYQLLTYKGDVDLQAKLEEWERFFQLWKASWSLQ